MSQPKLSKMCPTLSEGVRTVSTGEESYFSEKQREVFGKHLYLHALRVTLWKPQKRGWEVAVWQVVTLPQWPWSVRRQAWPWAQLLPTQRKHKWFPKNKEVLNPRMLSLERP